MKLNKHQQAIVDHLVSGPAVAEACPGSGKCLAPGTPILLFDGTVIPVEQVRVGDKLMGPDSKPRTVLSLAQGQDEMYRIVPVKGDPYIVNSVHVLSLKTSGNFMPNRGKNYYLGGDGTIHNIPLNQYLTMSKRKRSRLKGWRTGVKFRKQSIPVDPYYLGIWLGDGHSNMPNTITTTDKEVVTFLEETAREYRLELRQSPAYEITYYLAKGHKQQSELSKKMYALGVVKNKHIPNIYKSNTEQVRLELLAGLLDSDGHYSRNVFSITQKRKGLAEDILFLARSLGFAAYMKPKPVNGVIYWRIHISGNLDKIPTKIPRKQALPRRQIKDVLRTGIKKVESLGTGIYYGFTLDSDGLFLLGDFTVTHNTMTTEALVPALLESGVDPMKILVVTFTNKASGESRRRIALALFPNASAAEIAYLEEPRSKRNELELQNEVGNIDKWLDTDLRRRMIVERFSTIHALSLRTLKDLGYEFNVLAPPKNGQRGDIWWNYTALLKDGIKELDWDQSPRAVEWWFGAAVNNLVEPAEAEQWFAARLSERGGPVWDAPKLAELYKRYRDYCKRHKALDFNMMQSQLVKVIRSYPAKKKAITEMFDVIVVDEAQDTDPIQCEILWTMAAKHKRILFVGDVDQSLFSFRNAEPEVMRSLFEERWPNPKRFNLPINYRSTCAIIGTTTTLIQGNYGGDLDRYLKPFEARNDAPDGDPVTYDEFNDFTEMSEEIANAVVESPGDWFVLSRTRAECARIHTELIARSVPAINKSGGLLFGAPHVRKVLAYARLACNYQNARGDTEILSEIANVASTEFRAPMNRRRHLEGCTETRPWVSCGCPLVYEEGIDSAAVRFYGRRAIEQAGNWEGIKAQQYETNRGGYPTVASKGATDLVQFVNKLETLTDDARACLNAIIHGSVLNWLKHDQGIDDEDLAENGKAEDFDLLLSMADPDTTIEDYLRKVDELSQGSAEGDESESALIGTIHWSKGAQRPKVIANTTRLPIIPPAPRPGQLPTTPPPTIEEERRLLFVAMTRAQDECKLFGSLEWNEQSVERSKFVQALIDAGLVEEPILPEPEDPNDEYLEDGDSSDELDWNLPFDHQEVMRQRIEEKNEFAKQEVEQERKAHTPKAESRLLQEFPLRGRFEGNIYRFSALEICGALPEYALTLDGDQLVLERDLGGGSTVVVYTSVRLGQIAGGTGDDSVRVVRRDETPKGTFYFKEKKCWLARQVPKGCDTPEKAMSHITEKITKMVDGFTGTCPKCGATTVKCRFKNMDRTWWKCLGGCK